jgi:hypothetical protein
VSRQPKAPRALWSVQWFDDEESRWKFTYRDRETETLLTTATKVEAEAMASAMRTAIHNAGQRYRVVRFAPVGSR